MRHRDWDDAAAAVVAELDAARPVAPAAELLAADPRPPLAGLERLLVACGADAARAAAIARDDAAALPALMGLAAQARLWADWGRDAAGETESTARAELLGASPTTLLGAATAGGRTLAGLVARFEAHRGAWRGGAPGYVGRLASTAGEVAVALACLRHADRWPA